MSEIMLVYSTTPDEETAKKFAKELVEQKLAACVSMMPGIQSVYRWKGAVEEATEVCLMIKTTRARFQELASRILSLHPYDVPEIVALPVVEGLPSYLQWVGEETV